jgi:hypothetical protein
MKIRSRFLVAILMVLIPACIYCQTSDTLHVLPAKPAYPVITGYTVFFLPIVSTNSKTTTWNFSNTFTIGLATGINILYSDRFGFSFDLTPVITTTNGTSRVSNLIFDPGPIFRLKKGYSITTRMAFETAGRFGESTVLAKVFTPAKRTSLVAALGIPLRFGNNLPPSIGASVFFGIGFR